MVVILRPPNAAGTFYDINSEMLRKQVDIFFRNADAKDRKRNIVAAIVPHSYYSYSGQVAAYAYANIDKSNFVILGTNHSRIGSNFALMKTGMWKVPTGDAIVDEFLANRLLKECNLIEFDVLPHENEFSIEVQLPFILHKFRDIKILPILVNNYLPDQILLEHCKMVGSAIGKLVKREKNWMIIGTSDFSQNIKDVANTDSKLVKPILKLDPKGFFNRLNELNANVCGYGTIAATIFAAKEAGAKKAKLLKYGTSSDLGETLPTTTGYASIIFY
ncbi:MAG: AmmeMemoRadiSam system protein B [Candidatus Aenigmarchaeota archaeon]|nr:AmmeMemoRadiSam system protein B [Candidatus Aenigmarchaeota archaeon]